MALSLRPDDPRLAWHGAVSLRRTTEWVQPWRLPYDDRALFPPDVLLERAAMPAGVRLAFRSDTTRVAGAIVPHPDATAIDLCRDGALVASVALAGRAEFAFAGLPPGDKSLELWLPQFGEFRLRALELDDGATLAPFADSRPRWITYGSSITQCRTAASPALTWPAIVARERGLGLTCLGFGGQCHLDPMVARLIRDLPADFLSICVGINVYGGASLGPRAFRPAVIGAISIIRERHPDTPFAVLSPISSPPREEMPNQVGFTLRAMREEVAAAVEALRARGDRHLHYINGLDIFGPDLAHLLPDDLHPNAAGYEVLGRNFLAKVVAPLFPA
jgi:lysophospholipase L1-like esterase